MKAIIRLDVPDWQIGKKVSVYFPDSMVLNSICEIDNTDDQFKMRDATEEERKLTKAYIDSISKPTGLQFDDIYEEKEKIKMKTIVMGKKVTNNYEVVVKRGEDNKFIKRPFIKELAPDIEWEKICEYEGEAQYSYLGRTIYISEDEEVIVTEQIFRADLGNYIQYTDKVLDVDENNKPECEYELTKLLKEYNKQMIEDDERAKAYCDLHKLDYEESDYDEIIKIIGKENNLWNVKPDEAYGLITKINSEIVKSIPDCVSISL